MGKFTDLLGTLTGNFQFGLGGPRIKRNGSNLEARNAADNAFAAMLVGTLTALGLNVTADSIVLNSDAASAGADWKLTLSRSDTGMTSDIELVFPPGLPAVGQALTVDDVTGTVITFAYTTIAGGADKAVWDTTTIGFGSASPVAMFNLPASAVVLAVKVIIDTAFDGAAPQLSIGIAGTTSKYMAATQNDLKGSAGTVYEVEPGLAAAGGVEALIATLNADSSAAGSARVLVNYVIPS